MTQQAANPLKYSGDIKIGHWTSATEFGGYYFKPINFTELTIQPDGDMQVIADTGVANFGQAKHVLYHPKPTKAEFQIDEFNFNLLADLIRGVLSSFSQSSGTGVSVTKTLVLDRWVDVGVMNIASVAIDTLVSGTDFEVDPVLGQIMALTQGAVGEQTITFNKGAITGSKVVSGNTSPIFIGLKGQVENHHTGETGVLEIPKLALKPKTALMIAGGQKPQEGKFDGIVTVPPTGAPWTFFPALAMTAPA